MVVAKNLSQTLLNSLEEDHIIPLSLGTKTYWPTMNLKSMQNLKNGNSMKIRHSSITFSPRSKSKRMMFKHLKM